MIFNSAAFAVFIPIVLATYWTVPKRFQNFVLLVASYVFYGWWDWRFLSLLVFSTLVDYNIGLAMHRSPDTRRRNLLWLSIAVNLGILGAFKYFDFFVDTASDALGSIGLDANPPLLRLVLPVGISFYTFQTISYSFDIYRRRIEPTPFLVDFATYVAFFPQLVAGPIERAQNLLPQITTPRGRLNESQFRSGVTLFFFGLFKKIAVADMLAPLVENGFGNDAETLTTTEVLVAVVGFSIQIYADFSGYTDMARGVSRLLNIELMRNFEQPYLSRNITEFWQRWHISLSTWLRDYLYIPLGGNRSGKVKTYRNLLITMLLGGLWHGAGTNFIVWGALHGGALALHRSLGGRAPTASIGLRHMPKVMGTFVYVTFAWVFFRAPDFSGAVSLIAQLFSFETDNPVSWDLVLVVLAGLTLLLTDVLQRFEVDRPLAKGEWPAIAGALAGLSILAVVITSSGPQTPFIYFQF